MNESTGHKELNVLEIGMGWFPEQPGGLDRYYFDLMQSLGKLGGSARGLVLGSGAVLASSGGQVRAVANSRASLPKRWLALRREMKVEFSSASPPNVVAAHFALYTFPLLDRLRRVPTVVHFHGPWAQEGRREGGGAVGYFAKAAIERTVYRRADRCICLSQAFARQLTENFGVPIDRVRVVPGGVESARFAIPTSRPEAREQLHWPTDRPIVFCLRRLVRRMGLESLIDAVVEVRQTVGDVLVYIGGRGPLQAELTARIAAAGLVDHVKLLGFAADADLPMMYRAVDLSIVPTDSLEGFGLTTVESLAAGTPVLVTPVGGLPEVVNDLSPGLILKSSRTADIADGLTAALTGRLPLPSTEACTAYAARRFDWSIIARQLSDVYRETIDSFHR